MWPKVGGAQSPARSSSALLGEGSTRSTTTLLRIAACFSRASASVRSGKGPSTPPAPAADPVAINAVALPLADHAKVETSAVAMAARFFDQALKRGLCELWHLRPQCPRFCPRFIYGLSGHFWTHARAGTQPSVVLSRLFSALYFFDPSRFSRLRAQFGGPQLHRPRTFGTC